MKHKEILTTGEVARICHVAPRTVSKWFDSGKLKGYRIPGSRDRRIPRTQLVQFMRTHGMPLGQLDGHATRILLVDPDKQAVSAVVERLSQTDRYEVCSAANDFEAGVLAGRFRPHIILVDVVSDSIDAREILRNLRDNPDLAATRVVAIAGPLTRGQKEALLRRGFDQVLVRPYRFHELLSAVEETMSLVS